MSPQPILERMGPGLRPEPAHREEPTHPIWPSRCVHSGEVGRIRALDAQLATGLREHRSGIIADLLSEFGREIQGVAYLILRDHADAEEVLMDTLVTAWRRGRALRDGAALRTWLLRIATRHALSRRRRRRAHQPLADDLPLQASASMQPSADRLVVAEAMDALPAQMRAAVALHYAAGLSVPQTAEALGKSENTVKTQVREGMARLRSALDAPPVTGRGGTQTDARRA